jgi:hypothetical protein
LEYFCFIDLPTAAILSKDLTINISSETRQLWNYPAGVCCLPKLALFYMPLYLFEVS